jgi:hypothetical protein
MTAYKMHRSKADRIILQIKKREERRFWSQTEVT